MITERIKEFVLSQHIVVKLLVACTMWLFYETIDSIQSLANVLVDLFSIFSNRKYNPNTELLDDPNFIGINKKEELVQLSKKTYHLAMSYKKMDFPTRIIKGRRILKEIKRNNIELIKLNKEVFGHTHFTNKKCK